MSITEENSDWSLISSALRYDDVNTLRQLLHATEKQDYDDIRDSDGNTLLHSAILMQKYKVFNFLITEEIIDLESKNGMGDTPLLSALSRSHTTCKSVQEKFSVKLIEKGANVFRLSNHGNTTLHLAMAGRFVKVAQLLVKMQVEINSRNNMGNTPLHMLFYSTETDRESVKECVGLMLYHGADITICNNNGSTAFELAVMSDPTFLEILEPLFNYTYDLHSDYKLSSEVLCDLLENYSPLLPHILETATEVVAVPGVALSPTLLLSMKPDFLQQLVEKFDYVVRYGLRTGQSVSMSYAFTEECLDNFVLLLESSLTDTTIQYVKTINTYNLILKLHEDHVSHGKIVEIIFYLLTYGLTIYDTDLDTLYAMFGYNDLFKTVLHLDFKRNKDHNCDIVPRVFYDLSFDLESFLDDPHDFSLKRLESLLDYFVNYRLKYFCLGLEVGWLSERVKKLPPVPTLVQLARDATRKYLIMECKLSKSKQYFTLLQWLPISTIHRKILSFETKLYS